MQTNKDLVFQISYKSARNGPLARRGLDSLANPRWGVGGVEALKGSLGRNVPPRPANPDPV